MKKKAMRKITLLSILIGVLLIISAFIYFQSSQKATAPLPTATPVGGTSTSPLLKIANFSFTGYYNPVGLVWNYQFQVQVQNEQTSAINGATLTFDIHSNYTMHRQIVIGEPNVRYLPPGEQYLLGTIKPGEKITVNGFIENNLGDDSKLKGSTFVATLKVNNTILDEESMLLE
jgi:hypothetical protein